MRWRLLLILGIGLLVLPYFLVSSGDEKGLPAVRVEGPQETVFDWTDNACDALDVPDSPARAFRDFRGRVRLIAPHYVNRFMVGTSLGRLQRSCRVALYSDLNPDPARFDDRQWLTATYTRDGKTVFALLHQEYQGIRHQGMCSSVDFEKCWYNSITLATSHDGGVTFDQLQPPQHLVASVPYRYKPDAGPYGLFQPSNIILNPKDGYFYTLVRAEAFGQQAKGSCLLRTQRLSDPASWRAWGGSHFDVRFIDPYRVHGFPRDHVCTPVAPNAIQTMTDSLTYNTYFKKFMLVGVAAGTSARARNPVWGIYFSLSDDLLHWSPRRLIAETETVWTYRCGDRNPVLHPSIIDPSSRSRNFLTADKRAYLYFVRFKYRDCKQTGDRDLVRVPVRFSR